MAGYKTATGVEGRSYKLAIRTYRELPASASLRQASASILQIPVGEIPVVCYKQSSLCALPKKTRVPRPS